ncbi:Sister chromatid cohesion protein pds5 [Coemansia sp. RSA 552]|nr:Sister chromatid cohesion protein pds5 [Coemansia sp. RSA 552]
MTEDGAQELSFEPRLFTSAGQKKTVAVAELYKQLKRLSKELNALEQETVDTQSLAAVTRQLVAPALLRHKDAGVVAYVSCCLADILRLYAPDAPYGEEEIKQIFGVFADQLGRLGDGGSRYAGLREYVLASLATVRTAALAAMLDDAEETVARLFAAVLGAADGAGAAARAQMAEVLQQLVEEAAHVPASAVEALLGQFAGGSAAARAVAGDVAAGAAEALQKHIFQHFNEAIVEAATRRRAGDSGALDELRAAHDLIRELNRAAPATLLNVVPQIEEELGVDDAEIRELATGALGAMLGDNGFTLAKRHAAAWNAWKGRRADANAAVRSQWVSCAIALFQLQPTLARELSSAIAAALADVDERVRTAACRALARLDGADLPAAVVSALADRCKDRRNAVRAEAIVALATQYSQAVETGQPQSDHDAWAAVPSAVFALRYVDDRDVDSKVESILAPAVLAFARIKDDAARCQRLLEVYSGLDSRARAGFASYARRQRDVIAQTDAFLAACESGDTDAPRMAARIARNFPDAGRLEAALSQLAALGNSDIYTGLRRTMDADSDMRTVRRSQKAALKQVAALAPALLEPTAPLWKCVGLTTLNHALVPHLIGAVRLRAEADALLALITEVFPAMLRSSAAALFSAAGTSESLELPDSRLRLMVRYAKAAPDSLAPPATALRSHLAHLVRRGALRPAKYAASLLALLPGSRDMCAELAAAALDAHKHAPAIAALSRFALHAPAAFAPLADRASQIFVSILRTDDDSAAPADADTDATWSDDLDDAGMRCVYAVKGLTNWLAGLDRAHVTRAAAQTVVGSLRLLLRHQGSMHARPAGASGRSLRQLHVLRAAAAGLLKIARYPHLERALGAADVQRLALTVQDSCYEVRSALLLHKLLPALAARRIHMRFVPIVFLAAYDVEPAVRENVRHAVELRLSHMRPTPGSPSVAEDCLCRFLHILAHHPDWDDDAIVPTLHLFAPYIEFYITCVGAAQNVSLLFCYAGELKAYRNRPQSDGVNATITNSAFTKRLYILSELAQVLLREKSSAANWPVNVYPGRLTLPDDLFEPLSDLEKSELLRTPYLDPEFVKSRAKKTSSSAKRMRVRLPVATKNSTTKRSKSSKAKGKRAATSHDDDDGDDDDDDDMDEDSDSEAAEGVAMSDDDAE